MIRFWKDKKADEVTEDDVVADDAELDADTDDDADTDATDGADPAEDREAEEPEADESPLAKWDRLDQEQDWRENGPFDIDEVDLDADDVDRLDFGALVVTPVPGMRVQMQLNKEKTGIQALMVGLGESAIEVALFAAPAHSRLTTEVRNDIIVATQKAKGEVRLAKGPFGTEIRRVVPMKSPSGKDLYHVSRTWMTEGPGWLLRGVVMGKAAQAAGIDGVSELLYEFYANLVVRRPSGARVPGSLIMLSVPDELKAQAPESEDDTSTGDDE